MVGEGGPLTADAPPWAAPLFGFELLVDPVPAVPLPSRRCPTTPSSERVLALLLPEGVRAGQVEDVLRRAGGALLERVFVESDYRGPELARPAPGAWRSASSSARRTGRCATARWTGRDAAAGRAGEASWRIERRGGSSRTGG